MRTGVAKHTNKRSQQTCHNKYAFLLIVKRLQTPYCLVTVLTELNCIQRFYYVIFELYKLNRQARILMVLLEFGNRYCVREDIETFKNIYRKTVKSEDHHHHHHPEWVFH